MPRPYSATYTPADADADGIVNDATGADSPLTLLSSSAGDGLAHLITITSAANISGITFTITGTDADGAAQTEDITGPNATTVTGTKYFLTWTIVAISATLGANTADVGWAATCVSPSYPMNWRASEASVFLNIDGTIDYTLRQTFDRLSNGGTSGTLTWSNSTDTNVVTATADQITNYDKPATALQFVVNSFTAGATIGWQIVQADA